MRKFLNNSRKLDGLEIYKIKNENNLIYLARKADSDTDLEQINFDIDKRGRLKSTASRKLF